MAFTSDTASAAENILKNRIGSAPITRHKPKRAGSGLPDLPEVEAPDLDMLYVEVPTNDVPPPDEAALEAALHALSLRLAAFEPIEAGTLLELGDEVLIDLAVFDGEQVIPGTIRTNFELKLTTNDALFPDLAKKLVGHRVGETHLIDVVVPDHTLDQRFRGQKLRFSVRIKAARKITIGDLTVQAVRDRVEPGLSFTDLKTRTAEELRETYVARLSQLATEKVLEALVEEIEPVEVPEAYIDEQIRTLWRRSEGQAMAQQGFSFLDQQSSLTMHISDPILRDEAAHRIKIHVAFLAIMKRDGITIDEASFNARLSEFAAEGGVSLAEVQAEAAVNQAEAMQLIDGLLFERCLDHVMSRATIEFV